MVDDQELTGDERELLKGWLDRVGPEALVFELASACSVKVAMCKHSDEEIDGEKMIAGGPWYYSAKQWRWMAMRLHRMGSKLYRMKAYEPGADL